MSLVCVGRPRGPLAEAIADYEARIGHYFRWDVREVKETTRGKRSARQVVDEEGERLLARVPDENHLVALHRTGNLWSSEALADYLANSSLEGISGISFVIGGAYGLAPAVLNRARHQLSLSRMTFPHDLARLLLVEQIYRAGSISRGEPYHKGAIS